MRKKIEVVVKGRGGESCRSITPGKNSVGRSISGTNGTSPQRQFRQGGDDDMGSPQYGDFDYHSTMQGSVARHGGRRKRK